MSGTAERVARNASYTLASGLVAFVAGAVSSVVLARLLGPAGLGTYALVLSVGGVLSLLVTLGVPHAATKYVAEYEARGERHTAGQLLVALARLEVVLASVAGLATFVAAPWLERLFRAPGSATAFRMAAVGLPPGVLAALALSGLQGFQDHRRAALISMASTLVLLGTTVVLLVAGAGVTGAVGALALTAALSALLGWAGLRRHVAPSLLATPRTEVRAKLRRYVPAVSAVLLLDAIVWQRSEVFFLGIFRSPREVAWYALAFGVASTVMRLLPRALSAVLAPLASGLYGARDRVGMRALFQVGSRYLAILAAPLVVGGSVLAVPFFTGVYGWAYAPAAAAFPLLLLGAGFGAVGSVTASIQHGMERQDLVLRVAVVATIANLALDVALIPAWGVLGAAVANTVAQAGAVVAGIVLTGRLVEAPFPLRDCVRALAAAGVTGAVAYAVTSSVGGTPGLLAGTAAGALVYPAALVAVGSARAEDLDRLAALGKLLPRPLRPGYAGFLRLAGRWVA